MSDSYFVVKLALINIMIKPAKLHYTLKDGSAALIFINLLHEHNRDTPRA